MVLSRSVDLVSGDAMDLWRKADSIINDRRYTAWLLARRVKDLAYTEGPLRADEKSGIGR